MSYEPRDGELPKLTDSEDWLHLIDEEEHGLVVAKVHEVRRGDIMFRYPDWCHLIVDIVPALDDPPDLPLDALIELEVVRTQSAMSCILTTPQMIKEAKIHA